MSFLRKKKVKFSVEMIVQKLTDVPLLNAVIFAKVRLLDCGSFVGVTLHRPVCSHQVDFMSCSPQSTHNIRQRVRTISGQIRHGCPGVHRHSTTGLIDDMALYSNPFCPPSHIERRHSLTEKSPREYLDKKGQFRDELDEGKREDEEEEEFIDEHGDVVQVEKNPQPFEFVCYIPVQTGQLEECRCKISLRKEDRAGRSPQKLGFVILNLSEFAGSGSEGVTQSFLLEGYSNSQRQDNSRIHVHIRMQHNSADPLFKVPNLSTLFRHQNGSDEDAANSQQHEPIGNWLNPADRKAPPPSPNQMANSGGNTLQLMMTASTSTTGSNSVQIDSLYSSSSGQTGISTGSLPTSLCANVHGSTFSTVPGGLGHNMSMRVQKTRRDPGDVIDEVLAENSATIARKQSSSVSSSSGEYQSS